MIQPWWLGGKAVASQSVESGRKVSWWIESCLRTLIIVFEDCLIRLILKDSNHCVCFNDLLCPKSITFKIQGGGNNLQSLVILYPSR